MRRRVLSLDEEARRVGAMVEEEEERHASGDAGPSEPHAPPPPPPGSDGAPCGTTVSSSPAPPLLHADPQHDRRHATELFEACQRLDWQGEQLSRMAATATAELPAELRAMLARRRDSLRRESDFLSRRLAVLAQRMEASHRAGAHAVQSAQSWLAGEAGLLEAAQDEGGWLCPAIS